MTEERILIHAMCVNVAVKEGLINVDTVTQGCKQSYIEAALARSWEEGLVLVLGVWWGIPPLRAGVHGTKLANQLRRYSGCDTLVLRGVGV